MPEKQYVKLDDGSVKVVEITTNEIVKDLHQMKLRAAKLEADITGRHALFVAQKEFELAQAEKAMDAELNVMQAELDQLNEDIKGAELAGVIEIIPESPKPDIIDEPIL